MLCKNGKEIKNMKKMQGRTRIRLEPMTWWLETKVSTTPPGLISYHWISFNNIHKIKHDKNEKKKQIEQQKAVAIFLHVHILHKRVWGASVEFKEMKVFNGFVWFVAISWWTWVIVLLLFEVAGGLWCVELAGCLVSWIR